MSNMPPVGQDFERARNQHAQDEIRQQVFDDLQDAHRVEAGVLDENQLARRVNTSLVAAGNHAAQDEKKKQKAKDTLLMLSMLEQIRIDLDAMERVLADKYGEDFAEQLAADLLPSDTYKDLMKIEDKDERRRAIAQAINDGIRDGTIDPNDPRINDDYREWLDKHDEVADAVLEASKNPVEASLDEKAEVSYAAKLDAMFS